MNERLKSIVDLKKYPIDDLNSPTIKNSLLGSKEANLLKLFKPLILITLLSEKNATVRIPDFFIVSS